MKISKQTKSDLEECLNIVGIHLHCAKLNRRKNPNKAKWWQNRYNKLLYFINNLREFDVPPKFVLQEMKKKKMWLFDYFDMAEKYNYGKASVNDAKRTLKRINDFLETYG